jgi:hypothetical protein
LIWPCFGAGHYPRAGPAMSDASAARVAAFIALHFDDLPACVAPVPGAGASAAPMPGVPGAGASAAQVPSVPTPQRPDPDAPPQHEVFGVPREGNDIDTPPLPEVSDVPLDAARLPVARDAADMLFGQTLNAWCDDKIDHLSWLDEGPRLPLAVALAVGPAHPPVGTTFPTTVKEAMGSPFWPLVQKAMEDEIHGKVEENKAWVLVRREHWMRVLKSRWVLTVKKHPDGSVRVVKARLVACGYGQREGTDYTEVFAATLAAPSFRLLCALIANDDFETDQIDAYKAFTQADVDCRLFVEMPQGFAYAGYVLKLNKALEGIKQGAHLWYNLNRSVLLRLGFETSVSEPNLYRHPDEPIVVGVFADDILSGFHSSATDVYKRIKLEYSKAIKIGCVDITPVSVFIGVEIIRDREAKTVTLVQTSYIKKLFERYKDQARECATPYGGREELSNFEKLVKADEEHCIDRITYLQLCGALVWTACMTRLDTQYAVSFLCTFSAAPGATHYSALLTVLGYLFKTKHVGLTYGGKLRIPLGLDSMPEFFLESLGLHTYHDSSFGKGVFPWGGYIVFVANAAVAWRAYCTKLVPDSTAYAEMAVASKAAHATVAMRIILEGLGYGVKGPTPLLGDNQAVRDIVVKNGASSKTRHFERVAMTVKRFYQLLVVMPYLIKTKHMAADMFTKALDAPTFYAFRDYALNLNNGPGARVVLTGQTARLWTRLHAA